MDHNVVRDMLQAKVLNAIFTRSIKNELALKGGFAMRVLTGSARYTKDIDLSASNEIPLAVIQGIIRKSLKDMQNTNLIQDIVISEPKQTDTTQRWKINGNVGGQHIHFTIEISRRDQLHEHMLYKKETPDATITCINLAEIAAAKFDCMKNTNREAPRDIFDLYLLIQMNVKPTKEMIKKYGEDELSKMKSYIWDKIDKMTYDVAQHQLLNFMPKEQADLITRDIWQEMRLDVTYTIEKWINEAQEDFTKEEPKNETYPQINL